MLSISPLLNHGSSTRTRHSREPTDVCMRIERAAQDGDYSQASHGISALRHSFERACSALGKMLHDG